MSIRHPYDRSVHMLTYIHPANPAAGLPVQVIIPVTTRLQIVSVMFTLDTDANVGDRYVYVSPAQGGVDHFRFYARRAQAANTLFYYTGMMGLTDENGIAPLNDRPLVPLGVDMIFDNCDRFYITCENIQVGDQFSNIYIHYNTWYTGVVPT